MDVGGPLRHTVFCRRKSHGQPTPAALCSFPPPSQELLWGTHSWRAARAPRWGSLGLGPKEKAGTQVQAGCRRPGMVAAGPGVTSSAAPRPDPGLTAAISQTVWSRTSEAGQQRASVKVWVRMNSASPGHPQAWRVGGTFFSSKKDGVPAPSSLSPPLSLVNSNLVGNLLEQKQRKQVPP